MTPPRYVLTGAPSSGKSTLIEALKRRNYRTVDEAARFVIEREVAAGRDYRELRSHAADFQKEVLRMKVETERGLPRDEIIFLDRGMHDSIAYYRHEGVSEDDELLKACAAAEYRKIFVLDLISQKNFTEDGARSETWEGAQELDRLLEQVYRGAGFQVIRVPVLPVSERTDFVIANL